jgi:hypothetical protein
VDGILARANERLDAQRLLDGLEEQFYLAAVLRNGRDGGGQFEVIRDEGQRVGEGRAYGVWRAGKHDDLALALALACWRATAEDKAGGESARSRGMNGDGVPQRNRLE